MQSRRNFIGKVATGLAGTLAASNVMGANDRVRIGIIGPGARGSEILREALSLPNVECAGAADVYTRRLEEVKGIAPAAKNTTVPDLIRPGLKVLFCGINPSLYSAAVGHHFARPGNRFWPALHACGLTERLLKPQEEQRLLSQGLGITNLVAHATARAEELTAAELSKTRNRAQQRGFAAAGRPHHAHDFISRDGQRQLVESDNRTIEKELARAFGNDRRERLGHAYSSSGRQ